MEKKDNDIKLKAYDLFKSYLLNDANAGSLKHDLEKLTFASDRERLQINLIGLKLQFEEFCKTIKQDIIRESKRRQAILSSTIMVEYKEMMLRLLRTYLKKCIESINELIENTEKDNSIDKCDQQHDILNLKCLNNYLFQRYVVAKNKIGDRIEDEVEHGNKKESLCIKEIQHKEDRPYGYYIIGFEQTLYQDENFILDDIRIKSINNLPYLAIDQ